jgi:RNA recognition motif-containing protein
MGRTIKVEFSKSFRKPAPPPSPDTIVARYKLYVSNLAWKARSSDMKEFFSQYNPVSANVVFDDKKSAGYGFVSFGTKEEAETALSELDGKVIILETLTYQFYNSHQGLRLYIHKLTPQ